MKLVVFRGVKNSRDLLLVCFFFSYDDWSERNTCCFIILVKSEVDVGGIAVKVELSQQHSLTSCEREAVCHNGI